MKDKDRNATDPLAEEAAPPYGEPETPPPPPWYRRLATWYLKPAVKIVKSVDTYDKKQITREVSISTSGRRIRIVAFALMVLHWTVGLPLLWTGLLTSAASDDGIWSPAIGFSLLGGVFGLVGCLTYLADA